VKPTTTYGVSETGVASSVLPDTMSISVHSGAPGSVFSGSFVAAIIDKYKQSGDDKIIGLVDPELVIKCDQTLTSTSNFTTYPDRALIELTNSSGSTANLQGLSIRGKTVEQLGNGYEWEYTDHNDIEMRGESALISSNEYIVTGPQLEAVGDYLVKESKPHDVYTITIPGCHYEYEVGDVWHLTLDHTIPAQVSQCELIDVDVEIISSSINRSVGSIGTTLLDVMVPSGAWTKTIGRRARLISLGYGNMLNNRGNVLTVASSTWAGQADYYCDGIADNVQIQAAIDSLAAVDGGIVQLTSGSFVINDTIVLKSNMILRGSGTGDSCYLQWDGSGTFTKYIDISSAVKSSIHDITIYGVCATGSPILSHAQATMYGIYGNNTTCSLTNVEIIALESVYDGGDVAGYGFYKCDNLINCKVASMLVSSTGNTYHAVARGFYSCNVLTGCTSTDNMAVATNTLSAIAAVYDFHTCTLCNNCIGGNAITTGPSSLLRIGFSSCSKISNCQATGDGASFSYGFADCTSVQQCKSITNNTDYSTSYSDAGTSYACADTPNGGFNS
jgi:hypothetical protein